jgi:hypothetical protein
MIGGRPTFSAVNKASGQSAMEPTEIPGHGIPPYVGTIHVQGGVDHGLWQE